MAGQAMEFPATRSLGRVDVVLKAVRQFNGWLERDFEVRGLSEDGSVQSLAVTQYHFTSWPDRGMLLSACVPF